jgi:hypothetical protein
MEARRSTAAPDLRQLLMGGLICADFGAAAECFCCSSWSAVEARERAGEALLLRTRGGAVSTSSFSGGFSTSANTQLAPWPL